MAANWTWDETLYAGAASHYARGRMAYPSELGARIAEAVAPAHGRALDVGCGPGSLTLLLGDHFEHVVGIDADEQMVAEAELVAARDCVSNVSWRCVRGEQLPAGLGRFDLVAFAQSFHWMDRARVARTAAGMLLAGGACVHVHATTHRGDPAAPGVPHPSPPHEQIAAMVASYLGPVRRAGRSELPAGTPDGEDAVYRAVGFHGPDRHELRRGAVIDRSVDEIVSATFSLSSSTPARFGSRRAEFESDLRRLLDATSDEGRFSERVGDIAFDVWRVVTPVAPGSAPSPVR